MNKSINSRLGQGARTAVFLTAFSAIVWMHCTPGTNSSHTAIDPTLPVVLSVQARINKPELKLEISWRAPDDPRILGYNVFCGIPGSRMDRKNTAIITDTSVVFDVTWDVGRTRNYAVAVVADNYEQGPISASIAVAVDDALVDSFLMRLPGTEWYLADRTSSLYGFLGQAGTGGSGRYRTIKKVALTGNTIYEIDATQMMGGTIGAWSISPGGRFWAETRDTVVLSRYRCASVTADGTVEWVTDTFPRWLSHWFNESDQHWFCGISGTRFSAQRVSRPPIVVDSIVCSLQIAHGAWSRLASYPVRLLDFKERRICAMYAYDTVPVTSYPETWQAIGVFDETGAMVAEIMGRDAWWVGDTLRVSGSGGIEWYDESFVKVSSPDDWVRQTWGHVPPGNYIGTDSLGRLYYESVPDVLYIFSQDGQLLVKALLPAYYEPLYTNHRQRVWVRPTNPFAVVMFSPGLANGAYCNIYAVYPER